MTRNVSLIEEQLDVRRSRGAAERLGVVNVQLIYCQIIRFIEEALKDGCLLSVNSAAWREIRTGWKVGKEL